MTRTRVGCDVIVVGCGPSVTDERALAILLEDADLVVGVNDVERWVQVDHLVLLDRPDKFPEERREVIENTTARAVWIHSQVAGEWNFASDPLVNIIHTADPMADALTGDSWRFPPFQGSPLTAVCLAYRLGAGWIGVLGVDIVTHPKLAPKLEAIRAQFVRLHAALDAKGVYLANLGNLSDLGIPTAVL